MFNAQKPDLTQLPSTYQLIRSTIIAAISAIIILFTVILPAEYAIDPTGIGRVLGLTEMGEIKKELSEEAEADRKLDQEKKEKINDTKNNQSNLFHHIFNFLSISANAQEHITKLDNIELIIKPKASAEWKLVMLKGQQVQYEIQAEGGKINYDLHGHGSGNSQTYEKGRGSKGSKGEFVAAFDGEHGWFFRNRDKSDIKVTIKVSGNYNKIKK